MTKSQKKAGKAAAPAARVIPPKKPGKPPLSKAAKANAASKNLKSLVKGASTRAPGSPKPATTKKAATPKSATGAASKVRDIAAFKQARATAASLIRSERQTAEAGSEAICREVACEALATSGGYCRTHYIKNWKKIKRKELILKEGKLIQYIEELVAKYPDKFIEAIRQDLAVDKDFAKVIFDLELDENVDEFDAENQENGDGMGVDSMKREFEDDTETF